MRTHKKDSGRRYEIFWERKELKRNEKLKDVVSDKSRKAGINTEKVKHG